MIASNLITQVALYFIVSVPSRVVPDLLMVSKKERFEDTTCSRGLKLSKSKPDYVVSDLQVFVKQMPPMAFLNQAHSDECFFSFCYPCFTSEKQIRV
jgi:hypothetical protein